MKKNYRNDGQSYDDALQNKFTAYMDKALRTNAANLIERSMRYKVAENTIELKDAENTANELSVEDMVTDGHPLEFDLDYINDIALLRALRKNISEGYDRYKITCAL